MKKVFALLLAAMLALTCAACGEQPAPMSVTPADPTLLRLGMTEEPATADPALCAEPMTATLLHHLYEGLTAVAEDGSVMGAAAEGWEVSTTKDTAKRTVYTFTLRESAYWEDGTPVKAEDFIYAWTRIITGEVESPCRYLFDVIHNAGLYNVTEDTEAAEGEQEEEKELPEIGLDSPDESTLVVTLEGDCAAFPRMVSAPAFYPQRADKAEHYNGAYTMTEWVHDDHLTLVKNERYRNAEAVTGPTVEWVFRDGETLRELAAANELQASFGVTPNTAQMTGSNGTNYYYFYNTETLTDAKAREALWVLTLPTQATVVIQDGKVEATIPELPNTMMLSLWASTPPAQDKAAAGAVRAVSTAPNLHYPTAQALLAEAETKPENLTLLVCGTPEGTVAARAQEYADRCNDALGLAVTVKALPYDEYCKAREAGEYDIIRCAVSADYADPATLLEFFGSEAAGNWAHYSSEDYDKLLQKSRTETDEAERLALLEEAAAMLKEAVVLTLPEGGKTALACSPLLTGVSCDALGVWDFTRATYRTETDTAE